MLCCTFQSKSVADVLEFDDYSNTFDYSTDTAEYRFFKQYHYKPIFIIPIQTAFSAYCEMLINQMRFGNTLIVFNCTEYFEVSVDEWHAMRRGDKRIISQIQSPIKETVTSTIYSRDVALIKEIPYYTSDLFYNYLLYCLSGEPYYVLCNYLKEKPYSITQSKSDALSDLLTSDKYRCLVTLNSVKDPDLLDKFSADVKAIIER